MSRHVSVLVLLVSVAASASAQMVIHVDADAGAGAKDGTSWSNAYVDLQSALAAASSGDTIQVAEGTYKPTTGTNRAISFALVNGVSVYGGYAGFGESDPDARDIVGYVTVLSGDIGVVADNSDNSYHVVVGASDTILSGVTITGGNADAIPPADGGGGMYCTGAVNQTVRWCTFSSNSADDGGGMYSSSTSYLTVLDCTFAGNSTTFNGAGMYNDYDSYASVIDGCEFLGNSAGMDGGGLWDDNAASVSMCTFSGNSASRFGGGMFNSSASYVYRCRFLGNSATSEGGGISSSRPAIFDNCVFSGNSAGNRGGAARNSGVAASASFVNCTFFGNTATNEGGGLYSSLWPTTLTNCVIWGNAAAVGQSIGGSSAATIATYSCIEGSWPGVGNIDSDPLFADSDGADNVTGTSDDDFHLQAGSPCIDAGNGNATTAVDFAGVSRDDDDPDTPNTGTGLPPCTDMGAYEFETGIQWSPPPDSDGCTPGSGSPAWLVVFCAIALLANQRQRRAITYASGLRASGRASRRSHWLCVPRIPPPPPR